MKKNSSLNSPFLLFLPFLIFFILYILKFHTDILEGDEGGYLTFAKNLTLGFYSPPAPDINLWWGPGYPLFLVPFVALKIPFIWITLANALFQYLSIVMLFKSLRLFLEFREALIYSLIWAFCFSSYIYLYHILTEPLVVFLITSLIFSTIKAFSEKEMRYVYIAGLILGYIALTKVIFIYIVTFLLVGSFVLWLFNGKSLNNQRSLLIFFISYIILTPYLLYTYTLTGRLFYAGNSGGENLYWMTTPNENEYGDWQNESLIPNTPDTDTLVSEKFLLLSHGNDLNEIKKYNGVARDAAFKKLAIKNIREHPEKYIKNIISNLSRTLFGFPYSYAYQRPVKKIWYFAVLFSLSLFSLVLTIINWRRIPYYVRFLFILTFLYLGNSLMVYMSNRQLVVVVPLLLFWIAFMIQNSIIIKRLK